MFNLTEDIKCFFVIFLFLIPSSSQGERLLPESNGRYPKKLYWGDTHLHTKLSADAYALGNHQLTIDDAYKFARGEAVRTHNGQQAKLRRPLDFLVIADHSENLGVLANLEYFDSELLETSQGKRLKSLIDANSYNTSDVLKNNSPELINNVLNKFSYLGDVGAELRRRTRVGSDSFRLSVWQYVVSKADLYNEPGRFTAFAGYEWSSIGTSWNMLHRVVVFKDGMEKVGETLPFTSLDSNNPEELWRFLGKYATETGGDVIAIPHNSNLSGGEMFASESFDGNQLSSAYIETRAKWEPLVEVTQMKGDSESHPELSPDDEFADFETWGRGKEKNTLQAEYVRPALKRGLDFKARIGLNPFQFGLIGSTDSHTSLASAEEDNFWGKMSIFEPSSSRLFVKSPISQDVAASGYAAVWATENTRDSIFAAMKRREVYASTGPRIEVRFFGGWDFSESDAFSSDFVTIGYDKGVPMGGELTHAPLGKSPKFLIRAVKDPIGANLDRIQVVKGWRTENGQLREKIYNVALSDNRKDQGQATKPVGNTVNVKEASYLNTIGDPELAVVWEDPDFKAEELAFYYLRILEIPTPRWTAYDAKFFNISLEDIPSSVNLVLQERAYSSPIWYTPVGHKFRASEPPQ